MKIAATIAALALSASTAFACDMTPDRASVLIASKHIGYDGENDLNENNFGGFLTWECENWSLTGGFYDNSYRKTSTTLSVGYDFAKGENWAVGVFGGVSHYPDNQPYEVIFTFGNDLTFVGGLQARYENLFVQVIPGDFTTVNAIVAGGLTFDFGG